LRADGRHCQHFFSIDLCGHLYSCKNLRELHELYLWDL
jgi:hypothetical protein